MQPIAVGGEGQTAHAVDRLQAEAQIQIVTQHALVKIADAVVIVGIVDDDGRATKVVARKSGPACQRVRRHHADTHAEGQACSRYQVEGARFLYERDERRVVVIEHDVGRAIDDGLEDGIPVIVLDESKGHG